MYRIVLLSSLFLSLAAQACPNTSWEYGGKCLDFQKEGQSLAEYSTEVGMILPKYFPGQRDEKTGYRDLLGIYTYKVNNGSEGYLLVRGPAVGESRSSWEAFLKKRYGNWPSSNEVLASPIVKVNVQKVPAAGMQMAVETSLNNLKEGEDLSNAEKSLIDRVIETFNESPLYVKVQMVSATESSFIETLYGSYEQSPEDTSLASLSIGKRLYQSGPYSVVGYLGYQQFNQKDYQKDIHGLNAYLKLYYEGKIPWVNLEYRLGLGQGLSYVSRIPVMEARDFAEKDSESEKLMVYLECSADIPLSQFFSKGKSKVRRKIAKTLEEVYFGYSCFHRSSGFATFADEQGGANWIGIGTEFLFR